MRSKPARAEEKERGDGALAMLLVERLPQVHASVIVAAVKRMFPEFGGEVVEGSRRDGRDVGFEHNARVAPVLIGIDSELVAVIPVTHRLPHGTLDAATTRSEFWPEAQTKLADHHAHVIVGAIDTEPGRSSALKSALAVTMVTAAIADMSAAVGVYWVPAEIVVPGPRFVAEARSMAPHRLPIECWVHFGRVPIEAKGREAVQNVWMTTGLYPLIGRELEFRPSGLHPNQILVQLISIGHYLLTKGPVLRDDDRIDLAKTGMIVARLEDEGQRAGIPVIQLQLMQALALKGDSGFR